MSDLYVAKAKAVGGRAGHVESSDGLLKLDLALPPELGGKGGATNPEQLFAAGYAACFENAVRFVAKGQKLPLTGASVESAVGLRAREGGGFALSVSLDVFVEGLAQAEAEALVAAAHQVCPYSNAVRGNIDVKLTTHAA